MLKYSKSLVAAGAIATLCGIWPTHASAVGDLWVSVAPLPTPVMFTGATVVQRKIYLAGGDSSGCCASIPTDALQVYDPDTDAWVAKAPMPTARRGPGLTAIGNHVYAIGGDLGGPGGYAPSAHVERYDVAANTWISLPPLPTGRGSPVVAAVGGRIFVLGGWSGAQVASTAVDIYNPQMKNWRSGAPMPMGYWEYSVVLTGSKILLIGSHVSNFDHVWEYDTVKDAWTSKAPLQYGVRGSASATVSKGGPVYTFGGTDTGCNNPAKVEKYDPAANTWTYVAALPFGRFNPIGAAVDGLPYVIGGTDNPGCGAAPPLADVMRYLPLLTSRTQCDAYKAYGFASRKACLDVVN